MKASELIHGGLYLIHDTSDVVVRYDITSNSFRSEWYEYHLGLFHDDVCATDGDRYIFVKPIPLTVEILKANGFDTIGYHPRHEWYDWKLKDERFFITFFGDEEYPQGEIEIAGYIYDYNYAHQLQHALRLCGFNNLADNFKVTD